MKKFMRRPKFLLLKLVEFNRAKYKITEAFTTEFNHCQNTIDYGRCDKAEYYVQQQAAVTAKNEAMAELETRRPRIVAVIRK